MCALVRVTGYLPRLDPERAAGLTPGGDGGGNKGWERAVTAERRRSPPPPLLSHDPGPGAAPWVTVAGAPAGGAGGVYGFTCRR